MIFKRKISSQNASYILSDYMIIYLLFININVLKILPSKNTKILFILALIYIAWVFIKQLISFIIRLKESDLGDKEKQKGFVLSIVYIFSIILLTAVQIVVGLRL